MTEIIIISALAENNVIGKDNQIPWHIREDLLRFKKLTLGYPIIMGRKTWESLGCKPLPGRRNIILTSQKNYSSKGCEAFQSLDEAIAATGMAEKIFLIGGESIYREGLGIANTLELTRVHKEVEGDVQFPDIDFNQWQLIEHEKRKGFSFLSYKRKQ